MLRKIISDYNKKRKKTNREIFNSKTIGYLLTFVAGMMGVYTYKITNGVFGNGLTGDVLYIGINITNNNILNALKYVCVVLCFSIGVIISFTIRRKLKEIDIYENGFRRIGIAMEITLLLISYFIKSGVISLFLITVALGIQIEIFDNMRGKGLSTVNYVGNTKNAAEYIGKFFETKDRENLMTAGYYYIAFIFFALGGGVTNLLYESAGDIVVVICAMFLMMIFLLSFTIIKDK